MNCFLCGICCTRFHVRVSFEEAHRIADNLGFSWEEFKEKYLDPGWPGTNSFILTRQNGECIFLERKEDGKTTVCWIQDFKPSACSEWASGLEKKECREGLEKFWGIKINSSGTLEGSEENLKTFREFLKSIDDCSVN
jgi:Fe-S-cluster containining protein